MQGPLKPEIVGSSPTNSTIFISEKSFHKKKEELRFMSNPLGRNHPWSLRETASFNRRLQKKQREKEQHQEEESIPSCKTSSLIEDSPEEFNSEDSLDFLRFR